MPSTVVANSFLQVIDDSLRALLYTKFHDILNLENINSGVIRFPKEIAQREIADKRGAMEVEFINLWRTRVAPDWARMRTPVARRGMYMRYVDINTKKDVAAVKAVPVALDYLVWFWTHSIEKLNLIVERYLFWQQDDPNLNLNYTVSYVHESGEAGENSTQEYPAELDLHFGEVLDESTVSEKYERGQIFILRALITVDGWIPTALTIGTVQKLVFKCYDKNDLTEEQYSEIIVEDSSQDVEKEATLKLFVREFTE